MLIFPHFLKWNPLLYLQKYISWRGGVTGRKGGGCPIYLVLHPLYSPKGVLYTSIYSKLYFLVFINPSHAVSYTFNICLSGIVSFISDEVSYLSVIVSFISDEVSYLSLIFSHHVYLFKFHNLTVIVSHLFCLLSFITWLL